jgi:iron complex outermembrane receptor protein
MKVVFPKNIKQFVRGGRCELLLAGVFLPLASVAADASLQSTQPDSDDFSLEELVNVKVTTVSKKEQKLSDVPAAVYVLNNDDLRRSGATSVAEALRLVPGLDVAQINASQWAISSRGFDGQYANKLLVLVDGRTVYSPLFSGVYWDLQQQMLDDINHIEVVRGPGASVWGANAVNGVINIITESARDTQGGLIYGSGGDPHLTMDGARYGGKFGDNTYYRVCGGYQLTDDFQQTNGQSAHDGWSSETAGFRFDGYPDEGMHWTWQGDATAADLDDGASDAYNVNTLGRWTRRFSDRSSVEVQAYYDRTLRNEATRSWNAIDTLDLTAQHTIGLGARNDVIWGLGYRFIANEARQTADTSTIEDGNFSSQLFSGFVQDDFQIIPDKLTFTAGTKLEHNDITGFEFEPGVRATLKPAKNQTVWAAVSRAVRTPSELEGKNVIAIQLGPPGSPLLTGNPDLCSEVLWAYELGYRIQPTRRVNVDLATFYNDYSRLINMGSVVVPGTPPQMPWENQQTADSWGGELSVTFEPVNKWQLTANYSLLHQTVYGSGYESNYSGPQNQAMLRSVYELTRRTSLSAQVRYVGPFNGVGAYVTADLRLSYRPTENLELSLNGQNLFQSEHLEQLPTFGTTGAEVPRGFYGKITWHF